MKNNNLNYRFLMAIHNKTYVSIFKYKLYIYILLSNYIIQTGKTFNKTFNLYT